MGVSPDPVARLKKFEEKEGLNFTLLSDQDHALADKYGVWGLKKFMGREFMGIIRTTFIIDKKGRLVRIMDKVKTKNHHEDVAKIWQSYPNLNALKLHYRQYSDSGAPLLVLHGLFGNLSNWSWHCKQLAQHFAVIGVDLRNHGSSPHASSFNYPVMAQDVLQLLDHLKSVAAICWPFHGGKVAMELALTAPAKLNDFWLLISRQSPTETGRRTHAGDCRYESAGAGRS